MVSDIVLFRSYMTI